MGQIFEIQEDGTILRGGSQPSKKTKIWLIVILLIIAGIIGIVYISNPKNGKVKHPKMEDVTMFPDREKVKNVINQYYTILKNNQYDKLDNLYAYNVNRYFGESNVRGASIKERTRKYEEDNLGIYEKNFNVRWNTFEIGVVVPLNDDRTDGNKASVSYILDYDLNCRKLGYKEFIIKMYIEINEDYKIVSIYEDIISRK